MWFDAPLFHGKRLRTFPERGTTVYTRVRVFDVGLQRNTTIWGHRPSDYQIEELDDHFRYPVTFLGDVGGKRYLVGFEETNQEGEVVPVALEMIPQLISLVCGARNSRRSHVRHHESPYAKDASGASHSVGYDSEASPIRNMVGAPKPNKRIVALQNHDRGKLNWKRRHRAEERAERITRAARAPPSIGNSVTNASSGVTVPVVLESDLPARCSRQRYRCPPVQQLISVMLTRTKRATNELDHCEAFSDKMMRQRLETCAQCHEQW